MLKHASDARAKPVAANRFLGAFTVANELDGLRDERFGCTLGTAAIHEFEESQSSRGIGCERSGDRIPHRHSSANRQNANSAAKAVARIGGRTEVRT